MDKLNIMQMVKDYIEENRLSKASLSRSLGIKPDALNNRFRNDYMECNFLIRLSYSLNHDFFNDISELLELPKSETEKDVQLAELKKEVEILKRERDLLKELISSKL